MPKKISFSVVQKLLISAYDLEEKGKRPFSAEDLVVQAWKFFPDTFGLAGHRDENGILCYPDSNRVFAEIMGSKPIRKKGFLKKVGVKRYQLTAAGRDNAKMISSRFYKFPDKEPYIAKAGLSRETKKQLKNLLSTKALEKYKAKRVDDITFYDACAYWGISPRSSAIQLLGGIANVERVVAAALKDSKGKKLTLEHGGFPYTNDHLKDLLRVSEYLQAKFEKQLEIIKKRTDERRDRSAPSTHRYNQA
ncbi:MAG: hypothetical protein HWN69_08560 [Desulfobacterales bacterium]|nr:hypothetical protein [Desulfobacterales bacterium]